MFEKVSYSDGVLWFHTTPESAQSGSSTALRLAGLTFTKDSVSLGAYGPYPLPEALRKNPDFCKMIELSNGTIKIGGISRTPRKRPDWRVLTYRYRLYLEHKGIDSDKVLPPLLSQMIDSRRLLWNALCARCEKAIEQGQTIPAHVLEEIASTVTSTVTAFNNALGGSKDKIAFPNDDPGRIPAVRVGSYARFVSRLRRLTEEGRPVPEGLAVKIHDRLKPYPYDWSHFREFERRIIRIGKELAVELAVPAAIANPVIERYRRVFKQRRTNKTKGFDGIPHRKDSSCFDWFHEASFGSGGVPVPRLLRQGTAYLRLGDPVVPSESGHPLMHGLKATRRTLRPITFTIEGQEVTFALLAHRPLPEEGLLKTWRLVHRRSEYWVNFAVEIPPFKKAPETNGLAIAGLDINWRVLRDGSILLGMLSDHTDDTMILVDPERSGRSTEEGGMIAYGAQDRFRVVSLGAGPSRWGRNNLRRGANYGITDTFEGLNRVRQLRDAEKDALKNRIANIMGDQAPSFLRLCGTRGLKELAQSLDSTFPQVAQDIRQWKLKDQDILRVLRKATRLLDGRIKNGYEQLAHNLCSRLSGRGVRRIVIEESFLKKAVTAERKYQPEALKKSQRYRQAIAPSAFIASLEHIGAKYGIALSRHNAAYTSNRCRFCGATCAFGHHRQATCPGCGRMIDQDQNAAHNLRNAEIVAMENAKEPAPIEPEKDMLRITIGRVSPGGELRQKREVLLRAEGKVTTHVLNAPS